MEQVMANSARCSINYTPRMTDLEANDALPLKLRQAVNDSVTEWDSYYILLEYRRRLKKSWTTDHVADLIAMLRDWDKSFMLKGFVPARGRRVKQPSTFELGVPPLYLKERQP
jgi:hypothetical protein